MESKLLERLKDARALPTLPGAALQVLELCQQPEVELASIARVIGRDPALAARVLRVVNSPYFGVSRQIRTLELAVAILGMEAVRSLVLTLSILRGMEKRGRYLSSYWRRSLFAASAARSLSRRVDTAVEGEMFLIDLLQEIGILALVRVFPGSYGRMLEEAGGEHQRLATLELARLGGDHATVGGWLARPWQLPSIFATCIGSSHDL